MSKIFLAEGPDEEVPHLHARTFHLGHTTNTLHNCIQKTFSSTHATGAVLHYVTCTYSVCNKRSISPLHVSANSGYTTWQRTLPTLLPLPLPRNPPPPFIDARKTDTDMHKEAASTGHSVAGLFLQGPDVRNDPLMRDAGGGEVCHREAGRPNGNWREEKLSCKALPSTTVCIPIYVKFLPLFEGLFGIPTI